MARKIQCRALVLCGLTHVKQYLLARARIDDNALELPDARPTFNDMTKRALPVMHPGHVANCGAMDCQYNKERACTASGGIKIVFHADHADCGTYTRNQHQA